MGRVLGDGKALRAGFEPKEGMGEVVPDVVVLGREMVRLGFTLLADEFGLGGALVEMQRDGPMLSKNLE